MSQQRHYNLITAYTFATKGLGLNGELPWHIPADLAYFKSITTGDNHNGVQNVVVMGRKTWDSIPDKFKPLSNRFNIVITNGTTAIDGATISAEVPPSTEYLEQKHQQHQQHQKHVIFINWEQFLALDLSPPKYNKIFIIGGSTIYKKVMDLGLNVIDRIYSTEVYNYKGAFDCQFPEFTYQPIESVSHFIQSNGYWIRHIVYNIGFSYFGGDSIAWSNLEEYKYLNLMRSILDTGSSNDDRTGVGTLSRFGEMLKYNLQDTFPITTTKRIPVRQIFEELMFYISGKTDNTILQKQDIHIWDGNTSREFLDKRGLTGYKEGDFGETYGFNMRHYGGEYRGCDVEYSSDYGYDQLTNAIHLIKTDPGSRRIIIDLWNPATQHKAALPSCLCKYQFNVNLMKKELNLAIYLRSSDYFLANNWNTCTGAFLVHMICNIEGVELTPGELTVFIADAHIYKFHIEQVKKNLGRVPYPYPKLIFNCETGKKVNIDDFKFSDFAILGYKAHPGIKAPMAV